MYAVLMTEQPKLLSTIPKRITLSHNSPTLLIDGKPITPDSIVPYSKGICSADSTMVMDLSLVNPASKSLFRVLFAVMVGPYIPCRNNLNKSEQDALRIDYSYIYLYNDEFSLLIKPKIKKGRP